MWTTWHGRTVFGYGHEFDTLSCCGGNILTERAVGMATGDCVGMAVNLNVHGWAHGCKKILCWYLKLIVFSYLTACI